MRAHHFCAKCLGARGSDRIMQSAYAKLCSAIRCHLTSTRHAYLLPLEDTTYPNMCSLSTAKPPAKVHS